MTVSARSYLVAGLVAATVGTAAVVQVNPAGRTAVDALSLRSSGFDLTAAVAPLIQPFTAAALGLADGAARPAPAAAAVVDPSVADPSVADSSAVAAATGSAGEAIINIFNTVEPFVQYGFELTAWAAGYLPWPIGWLGQQINIAYNTGEPIVQALVYSFAYLIDGQFDLIGPTLAFGFNLAVTNFVQGEINWVLSFLPPLPPLPPPPPFPTAAVASRAAVSGPAAAATAAPAPTRTEVVATESTENQPTENQPTVDPIAIAAPEAATEAPAVITSARARQSTVVRTRPPAAANTATTAGSTETTAAVAETTAAVAETTAAVAETTAADSPAVAPEAVAAVTTSPVNEPRRATRSASERAGSTGTRSAARAD